MKCRLVQQRLFQQTFLLCLLAAGNVSAAVHYVDVNGTNPIPPYADWATAAATVQDAIDVAGSGDQIVVTNGVYETGGRVVSGLMTNRVAVTKPVTVRSVNGPELTVIRGFQVPGTTNGDGAVRCVYLTNGAVLAGFTLTSGATRDSGDAYREQCGGGVWSESTNSAVSNCVLADNSASWRGGGAYGSSLLDCTLSSNSSGNGGGAMNSTLTNCTLVGNFAANGGGVNSSTLINCTLADNVADGGGGVDSGTLRNCSLVGNAAHFGGGSRGSVLQNCTLVGNSAFDRGGGAFSGNMNNCIVYYNTAPHEANYSGSILNYCCTMPIPPGGTGNISGDPQLAGLSHLSDDSPCRGAGSAAYTTGVDVDGEPWAISPSIGCDEFRLGSLTGTLNVGIRAAFTNIAVGFELNLVADISGRLTGSRWEFGDGNVSSNRPYASYTWTVPGNYPVVLRAYNETHPNGISATVTVQVEPRPVHYVMVDGANPAAPYSSWATAATNIQDAVDAAALPGSLVLVSNGVYSAGGRVVHEALTNRVAVTKPLTVRSLNGPELTLIRGHKVLGGINGNGDGAVRCVYLTNGAALIGFTLTNGATRAFGDTSHEQSGGGVWCEPGGATLSLCVLVANSAYRGGGGAYQGILNNCTVSSNYAYEGGGTYSSVLNNCMLNGNSSGDRGGGGYGGTFNSSLLADNRAYFGGGASLATLNNSTVVSNSAANFEGGGTYACFMNNCVVYYNTAGTGANYSLGIASEQMPTGGINYCSTTPLPAGGVGNLTNSPLFVDLPGRDLHLQTDSPCIDAGWNGYAPGFTDLDNKARIVGDRVDIGAYEFQTSTSIIPLNWLQQYGLPLDGSADFTDPDGDGLNNWQEWRSGTNPTNALSVLRLVDATPGVSGVVVRWESVSGLTYFLERSVDLEMEPPFQPLISNVVGQASTTTYTDTNAIGSGSIFYRVGVQD